MFCAIVSESGSKTDEGSNFAFIIPDINHLPSEQRCMYLLVAEVFDSRTMGMEVDWLYWFRETSGSTWTSLSHHFKVHLVNRDCFAVIIL